ncbi:ATP-grasp fold amidoligase family protein [Alkalibacterium kapii]|uniref:Glycosyl transferase n=1 Tax=Alkalibacterium kapii TaxID=426704 RepID=A0A511ASG2_9LACT|nr:ATP-grasp fold amidoligase family protein [Alkalibacterium kapii]GEK91036.1 glycosyl transferase [Alkalibacterium kapii]
MDLKRITKFVKQPQLIFLSLGHIGVFKWMKDETYLKIAFYFKMGKKLDLNKPKTYSEKLQWLKLNDRDPNYTSLVDKYEVRKFIEKTIGENYLIPLLGVWYNVDEIDFDELPNEFVLKCTHDSGGVVICKDKRELDIKKAKKKLQKSMKHNYYWGQREWPYKNITPKIIAEKYMIETRDKDLKDYKFMCFNGVPKVVLVVSNRNKKNNNVLMDFYDPEWNKLNLKRSNKKSKDDSHEKPINLDNMLEIATILSRGYPFIRVDFYEVNRKLYFGELTLYPASGMEKFSPDEWDNVLGTWTDLSIAYNNR